MRFELIFSAAILRELGVKILKQNRGEGREIPRSRGENQERDSEKR
jgi:hypothetical protein